MKLIDLLVQELPKHGGWPDPCKHCWQDFDKEIRFDLVEADFYSDHLCENYRGQNSPNPTESDKTSVTREQYEAALQHPVWNGEGLPPVGCECEGLYDTDDDQWFKVRIIAHDDDKVIGRWLEGLGEGTLFDYVGNWSFRQIRTEAERKREETISSLRNSLQGTGYGLPEAAATIVYDAIAAGKIPGVTLL